MPPRLSPRLATPILVGALLLTAAGCGRPPADGPPAATAADEAGPAGPGSGSERSLARLEARVGEVLDAAEGRYGVLFRVLSREGEIAIRADEPFFAASCYKVPLVLFLFEQALEGRVDLEEKLTYTQDFYRGGAGILQHEEPGSSYNLRYLASLAIIDSDNIAAGMLLDRLGRENVERYQWDLGAGGVDLVRNLASPRDVALVLERLLLLTGRHPDRFGEILDWMKVSYPRDRIPAGLPAGVGAANKTGTWSGVFNDAALIFTADAVMVLVVMSKDVPTYADGMATIAAITAVIYSGLAGTR